MRKGMALTTVFIATVVAVVIVGSAFAFFSNVPDSAIVTIGADDSFSVSLGEAGGTAQLRPQVPTADNSGDPYGEETFARVTIPYTVASMEGVTAITLRVTDIYRWTKDGASLGDDLATYVNQYIVCRLYADGGAVPEWGTNEYLLPDISPGTEGTVILEVKLDLVEELAPEEIEGATLTVRVGISKTTSGA